MSPLLFLLVFEDILKSIPAYEGVELSGETINHIAYADDLVLIANSAAGLQNIYGRIITPLAGTGLEINVVKPFTVNWIKDGKNKRMLLNQDPFLSVNGQLIPALAAAKEFTYLGVKFYRVGKNAHKI